MVGRDAQFFATPQVGSQIEVFWRINKRAVWWLCDVGDSGVNQGDGTGKKLHSLTYSAMPEHGFHEVATSTVCFCNYALLYDHQEDELMRYRRAGDTTIPPALLLEGASVIVNPRPNSDEVPRAGVIKKYDTGGDATVVFGPDGEEDGHVAFDRMISADQFDETACSLEAKDTFELLIQKVAAQPASVDDLDPAAQKLAALKIAAVRAKAMDYMRRCVAPAPIALLHVRMWWCVCGGGCVVCGVWCVVCAHGARAAVLGGAPSTRQPTHAR